MNIGLFEPDRERIADPVYHTGAETLDQLRMRIELEPVVTQHRHRHQPVGAGVGQRDE